MGLPCNSACSNYDDDDDDGIRPFEWLTNAASLKPLLDGIVVVDDEYTTAETKRRALHVGCGSSTVGEYLIEDLNYDCVVNVDMDGPTLRQMEKRWQARDRNHGSSSAAADDDNHQRLVFCQVDLAVDQVPYASGYFDLVIDKSTLDCTLCSDEATAGLLCEVYRSLNAAHGSYVVISFHSVDLLLPLLRDCPGTDWIVSHYVIRRQVEDVFGNSVTKASKQDDKDTLAPCDRDTESTWTNGSFQPTEEYHKTVNVMICKRRGSSRAGDELDRSNVRQHVHETNDLWFQRHNPLLTRTRHDELRAIFDDRSLDLPTCYNILFTDAEREHLTFEHFLQDWDAFLSSRPHMDRNHMTLEIGVAFLEEMQ